LRDALGCVVAYFSGNDERTVHAWRAAGLRKAHLIGSEPIPKLQSALVVCGRPNMSKVKKLLKAAGKLETG
jgi:hypothetical protein